MSDPTPEEAFVQNIATNQNRIFGYIFSMLGDHSRSSDVLQETNLVLWRKKDSFQTSAAFLPWAFGIARMQVLAHLRDHKRDRLLLDAELVEALNAETENKASQIDSVREALRFCMGDLPPKHRELIQRLYFQSKSIQDLAESLQITISAVKVTLMRVRRRLAGCVQRRMELGEQTQ